MTRTIGAVIAVAGASSLNPEATLFDCRSRQVQTLGRSPRVFPKLTAALCDSRC